MYSFSPAGDMKKFPKRATMDSAIQDSPSLHCSGSAVYISQTVVEGKTSHAIGEKTYISAMKPRNVIFTLLVPATGSIYWSESYPGDLQFLYYNLSKDKFLKQKYICKIANPKCSLFTLSNFEDLLISRSNVIFIVQE